MRARKTLVLTFAALAGCGDIIGLDGYGEGDGSVVDAMGMDSGGGDVKVDVKSDAPADTGIGDAGNDVVTTCTGGGVCVPALPGGWAWAVYAPDMRPPCAMGYSGPTDVNEGIDASAASCGCGCTTTNPTCTGGNLTINSGTNAGTCNNITMNQTDTASAGCHALSAAINDLGQTGPMVSVAGPTPSGGSCNNVADASVPAVGFDHQGRTCGYTGTPGAGCTSGNVCVPDPTPFGACVSHVGMNACPPGFANQHLIGTMVNDTRGCTACGACTFDAGACDGTTTFYRDVTSGTCTSGTTQAITTDGTCHATSAHNWNSYKYAPTTTASCAAGTSSADGGAVFGDLTTVCCQ